MKALLCEVIIAALICLQPEAVYAQNRPRTRTFRTAKSIHVQVSDQFGNSIDTHAAWSAVSLDVLEEYYGQVMASVLENAPPPTIYVLESHKDQIRRLENISKKYKKPANIVVVPDSMYKQMAEAYPVLGTELAQAPLFVVKPGTKKIFSKPTRSDWYVGGMVTVLGGLISYKAMILGQGIDPDVIFKILSFQAATVTLFQIFHTTVDNLFEYRLGFAKEPIPRSQQLFLRIGWDIISKSLIRSIAGPVGFAHPISDPLGKIEVLQNVGASATGSIPYYITRNETFRPGDLRSEARRLWWGVNAYLPGIYFSFRDQMGQTGAIVMRFHDGIGVPINVYASTLEIVAFYLLGAGFLITFPDFAKAIADLEQAAFEIGTSFLRQCGQALSLAKKK